MNSLRIATPDLTIAAVPSAEMQIDEATLAGLGHSIADSGIASHESDVLRLGWLAHGKGVSKVLIDVMVGEMEPAVARERAFAGVVSQLVAAA